MDVVLFLMPVPATIVIAALVALAPAVVNAWRDRTLLAHVDDPALPERLLATRWWIASSFGLSFGLLVAIWPWQTFWTVPLLLLSRRWMAFRLRRTLLGETWSFFLYLNFFARTALAVPAFSLLLLGTPIIVWAADDTAARWAVAATLGLLLTLWQLRHTQLLLWLWRATPIARARQVEGERNGEGDVQSESEGERGDLTTAFDAVIAKARVASPPRVWQAGPPGAVVANAVALPSVSGAEVVFSRTLLERMTVDELVAVFAHEVAHLEYFNRARMMRQRMLTLSQIFAGVLLVPLLATFAPGILLPAMALWPLFVLLTTIGRTTKVHGNELASDRRAIELCENPEALMSGLTKIHTIGRLPRRWDAHATKHPSLARRMRAIRELAGFRAPAIEQIEIFASPTGDSFLLLDRAMLQYASGVPLAAPAPHTASTAPATPLDANTIIARAQSVRRVAYASLKSCRIVARWKQPAALRVTDQAGRSFEARLRDADVPRLHDLLDIIEFGLPVDTPAPLFNERAIAFGLLIVAVCVGHVWSLALLAALALIKPAAEMLISAALALSVAGALQWIDPTNSVSASPVPAWVLVALGGVAIDLVLWRLWSGRAARISLPPWCIAIILGSALLVWMHGLLQWDGSLLRLAQVARVTPAAVLLPLGAVLLVARSRLPLRWVLASVLLIAGLVPAAMTTRWFQDDIVRDPLLSVDAPLPLTSAIVDMIGAAHNDRGDELRISPEGHSLAMAEADEESEISDFVVRTPNHQKREVGAADLQFLDDTRAVVLVNESAGLIVRLENFTEKSAMPRRVAPPSVTPRSATPRGAKPENVAPESVTPWSVTLPNVRWGRLSIAPHTQRWRVIGRDGRNQVVRAQGIIGSAEYDDVRWRMDEGGRPFVGSGNAMLVTRTDWRASLLGRLLPELAMATSTRSSFDVSMWRVRTGAPALMTRSSADVDCLEPPVDLEPAVCFAFDGIATRIWTISADDKRVAPMGVLPGYARPLTRGADGTVVAWWRNHPVLLQIDPLCARELPSIPMSKWGRAALASDYLLIGDEPGATTLAIYRVQSSSASEYTRRNEPAR
jgi:Zn-dependent protease with chaperone function